MKKLTALCLTLILLLSLFACGGQAESTPSEAVSPDQAASDGPVRDTAEPSAGLSSASEETATPEPSEGPSADDLKAIAIELSERRAPVSELYEAIGEPSFSDYGPSCLDDGAEDGELHYDGFVVYTVRTDTREYVYDVL